MRDDVGRFHYLADALEPGTLDDEYLAVLEAMDHPFPNADCRRYRNANAEESSAR